MKCDVLIVGGGTGGSAAALALSDKGWSVVLTEETDWLGGQLTSQIVPPDEHPWIEHFGRTQRYADFRESVRARYRSEYPGLGPTDWPRHFNPGGGWVSRICHRPQVGATILDHELSRSPLTTLRRHVPVSASVHDGRVVEVLVRCLRSGVGTWIEPRFVLDATELGDLLPMTETEYVTGAESQSNTDEPHAVEGAAQPENVQSFTWCAAIGYDPKSDHTIPEPDQYRFWRSFAPSNWTGKLLDLSFPNVRTGEPMTLPLFDGDLTLFGYRQIVDPQLGNDPTEPVTVMNWPQNDYMIGSVIDVDGATKSKHFEGARQLTLSVLYWLQTEVGFKGLRLRPDITGTTDGLAMAPYHRESRRIKSLRIVREQDVSPDCHPGLNVAPHMWDSVGVGAYRIDLHPAANGAQTIDISSLPFQIPLGALVPHTTKNLLPACKNIGTTHITNGCYRLHPVEWNIGEASGLLAHFCLQNGLIPQDVYSDKALVRGFQDLLVREGVELEWPKIGSL